MAKLEVSNISNPSSISNLLHFKPNFKPRYFKPVEFELTCWISNRDNYGLFISHSSELEF